MFKKIFVAAAMLMTCPALASAQDIYWSLSETEDISTSTLCLSGNTTTGSAYIFADPLFCFNAIDLNFTTSDTDVIRFTGGEAFNFFTPNLMIGQRFDVMDLTIATTGDSGGLLIIDLEKSPFGPIFDPAPELIIAPPFPGGPGLLARVDFEVVGEGTADLEFALGPQGALQLPDILLNPSFGSATLTVEASSMAGCLGDVNLSGSVDFLDIVPFVAVLFSQGYQFEADINGDGVVSFLDIVPFVEILTGS